VLESSDANEAFEVEVPEAAELRETAANCSISARSFTGA
jgi:hypothetical protein